MAAYQDIENANLPIAVPVEAHIVPTAPPSHDVRSSPTQALLQQPTQTHAHAQTQPYQPPPHNQNVPPSTAAPSAFPQPIQQEQRQQQQQQQHSMNDPVLKRHPMMMRSCPLCGQESRTRVVTGPNWITWIFCILIFCLCWPLCWVPLVVDSMKLTRHFCVLCNGLVGRVEPLRDCCVSTRT